MCLRNYAQQYSTSMTPAKLHMTYMYISPNSLGTSVKVKYTH